MVDKDGYIILTEAGENAAEKIFERHSILTEFLISLGVSEAVATDDACRIEHVISDETLDVFLLGSVTRKISCLTSYTQHHTENPR